ncbi:hypothetical protein CAB17_13950 [Legionella sainthelensi]|uniref:Uncharacterized protein n=1 Tax=Legionella sainthelensi TaxID=28087 RepID=A0A2H5FNA3_9GAMM|nr:hypothetical protein CAB17_13950 [Legionella sainthelensi]
MAIIIEKYLILALYQLTTLLMLKIIFLFLRSFATSSFLGKFDLIHEPPKSKTYLDRYESITTLK